MGDFGCCLINYMVVYYLSFYASVIMEIPLARVGIIMLVVQCWDAVNDLLVGQWVDQTQNPKGRARIWIRNCMLPCCASGILIFICPKAETVWIRTAWIGITYFAFIFLYTCMNIPYSALLSYMTDDSAERARLSTVRYIGASAGMLMVSTITLPTIHWIKKEWNVCGYGLMMAIYSGIALIMFYTLYKCCKESKKFYTGTDNGWKNFYDNIKNLLTNRAWCVAVVTNFVYWLRYPFYGVTMVYYFRFYLGKDEALSSVMCTIGILASIVILPFVSVIARKTGYKKALYGSCLLSGSMMFAGFLAGRHLVLNIVFYSVNYMAESFPCVLLLTMIADALDENGQNRNSDKNGTGFAINSFFSKVGTGLGGFLVPVLLSLNGLETTADITVQQSANSLWMLRILFWLIPTCLSLVMIPIISRYPFESHNDQARVNDRKEGHMMG